MGGKKYREKWHILKRVPEIAAVGKFTCLFTMLAKASFEAYGSTQALCHGAPYVDILWVDSQNLAKVSDLAVNEIFDGVCGSLCLRFRQQWREGALKASKWARGKEGPVFGICFGLQCAVIETARKRYGAYDAKTLQSLILTP